MDKVLPEKSSWRRWGLRESLKEAKEGISGSRRSELEMRKGDQSSEEGVSQGRSKVDRQALSGPGSEVKAQA